jgi:hypothetical protein
LPANKRAVAFPIPDIAPVISVTFPMRTPPSIFVHHPLKSRRIH